MPHQLRPAIATTEVSPTNEPERLHPLLWPLAAYLAIATITLFLVAQVDALAAWVMPWDEKPNRWHEGSAGWMALFPLTTPVLLVYGLVRLGYAVPLRAIELVWRGVKRVGLYFADAWNAVRRLIHRTREALRLMLHDAMRAVRRTAEVTVRRVRAALGRLPRQ
jgi:hypothetical protein